MTTRPTTTPPEWLATGNTSTPATGQRTTGWIFGQKPPAEEVNWFWALISEWMLHMASASSKLTALEDAEALTDGDTFVLDEDDTTARPGNPVANGTASSARDVDAGGFSVVTTHTDNSIRLLDRDLANPVTVGLTNAGTPVRVVTDGVLAWVAYGQYVEQFSGIDSGVPSSDWVYDHGAAVNDICADNGRVYLVGVSGTGAKDVRALSQSTGLAVWSGLHNATLQSCCCDGYRVYIGGAASGSGSGAHVRAVVASNGYDKTNELGNGVDATNAWDLVLASAVTANRAMACDDHRLFVARSGGNEVRVHAKAANTAIAQVTVTAAGAIALDQDRLYAMASSTIHAFSKADLSQAWSYTVVGGAPVGLASDGARLFAARTAANDVSSYTRGNVPGLWKKVAGTDYLLPRQRVIPASRS